MQTILPPEAPVVFRKGTHRAVIEVAGCAPGYGMTLGNAIRRVLLSSLPGTAITSMKISGIPHEFTTIPGVLEDVTIIMLNLKQVRFRMHGEGPERLTLSKKGAGEVTAADICVSSNLEVANPALSIATLTSPDADLEMELEVERGLGYVPSEEHRREKAEVGLVALDALFSPVKRVHYEVENMRVGDRTDFNRIRFDIETDGTMEPEEAFRRAVDILVEHFEKLRELQKGEVPVLGRESMAAAPETATESTKEEPSGSSAAERPALADLKLKTRIMHALAAAHIETVEDIISKSEEELLALDGFGDKAVKEIKKAIGKHGLILKEKQ